MGIKQLKQNSVDSGSEWSYPPFQCVIDLKKREKIDKIDKCYYLPASAPSLHPKTSNQVGKHIHTQAYKDRQPLQVAVDVCPSPLLHLSLYLSLHPG